MSRAKRTGKNLCRLLLLAGLLLLPGNLFGCRKAENDEHVSASSEKTYTIYYINEKNSTLSGKQYTPAGSSFDDLLNELLEQYGKPNENWTNLKSGMPAGVQINGHTTGVDNLIIDFNGAYLGMDNVTEILLRSSLVKTLVQLPGVVNISFTVDGQPLTEDDGSTVGAMNEDTFIDTQGNGINSYHYVSLDLYFPDETGQSMCAENRNVFYSSNLILEKVVANELIKGPQTAKLKAAVSTDCMIRSLYIEQNICVIDFEESVNKIADPAVDPETALYCFVNAICEIRGLDGVQFRINGSSDERFMDQVSLAQVFKPDNSRIVKAEEPKETSAPQTELKTEKTNEAEQENEENDEEPGGEAGGGMD